MHVKKYSQSARLTPNTLFITRYLVSKSPPTAKLNINMILLCVEHLIFTAFSLLSFDGSRNLTYPKKIWTFFDKPPEGFVQTVLSRTSSVVSDEWDLIFLTSSNISTFIPPSSLPASFSSLSALKQSDYLRLFLVSTYGGWWIDASTLITNSSFLSDFVNKAETTQTELLAFCTVCPKVHVETGTFYAPQGSVALAVWYEEMHKALNMGLRNYIYDLNRNGFTFSNRIFNHYPNVNSYFAVFAAQAAMFYWRAPRRTPMIIEQADDYIFKFLADCKRKLNCIKKNFDNSKINEYPITKFTGKYRRAFDDHSGGRKGRDTKPLIVGHTFPEEVLIRARLHILYATLFPALSWIILTLL